MIQSGPQVANHEKCMVRSSIRDYQQLILMKIEMTYLSCARISLARSMKIFAKKSDLQDGYGVFIAYPLWLWHKFMSNSCESFHSIQSVDKEKLRDNNSLPILFVPLSSMLYNACRVEVTNIS